jgi:hypothetical protein
VRYEELCRAPAAGLRAVLDHCSLGAEAALLAELAGQLHAPTYYQPRFSAEELAVIDRHTRATAARLGYAAPAADALSVPA